MAPQQPGTTLIRLVQEAKRLRLDEAIKPADVRHAATTARIALDGNGNAVPTAVQPIIPLQSIGWFISGWVVVSSNAREELTLPQAATAVRLVAYCKIAPASGPMTAELFSNGTYVESVSISVGETVGQSQLSGPRATLPALARLHLAVTSHGNASDASINLLFQPLLGGTS